jgi:hypothetical protein
MRILIAKLRFRRYNNGKSKLKRMEKSCGFQRGGIFDGSPRPKNRIPARRTFDLISRAVRSSPRGTSNIFL